MILACFIFHCIDLTVELSIPVVLLVEWTPVEKALGKGRKCIVMIAMHFFSER